jgi:magnesium chelatase subunit D
MMAGRGPELSRWERAVLAAKVFALAPLGSGIIVRGRPGPVRDAWLKRLYSALPRGAPVRRIPASIADDRLVGGLDVAATLQSGRPVPERGVIAETDGGVLVIAMAERLSAGAAARIAGALDEATIAIERDGLSLVEPAHVGFVALDEGADSEEVPPAILVERCAMCVDLEGIAMREVGDRTLFVAIEEPARPLHQASHGPPPPPSAGEEKRRRPRLSAPMQRSEMGEGDRPKDGGGGEVPEHFGAMGDDPAAIEALVGAAAALGVASLRAPLYALGCARALAALDGADRIEDAHVALAAALALGWRATRLPADPEETAEPPPEPDPDRSPNEEADSDREPKALDDVVLDAAAAAVPPDLLARLKAGAAARARAAVQGKAGDKQISTRRGRPIGTRPGLPREGRIALVATLRAAAPWQPLRRREYPGAPNRLRVLPDDLRIVLHNEKRGATTIFVVDASGSSAMQRLAEIKGAIELLLADCYVRRDSVALIAFRGRAAEVALPPTRSTARARARLAGLPGGGGTPLALGLDAAAVLAGQVKRTGQTPFVVLMTDGRANVSRSGEGGRPQALEDALDAARRLFASGVAALAIDTSAPSRQSDGSNMARIAEAMGAACVKLPVADSRAVNAAVRASTSRLQGRAR